MYSIQYSAIPTGATTSARQDVILSGLTTEAVRDVFAFLVNLNTEGEWFVIQANVHTASGEVVGCPPFTSFDAASRWEGLRAAI